MSTLASTPTPTPTTTTSPGAAPGPRPARATYGAIPFARIVSVELRKTFDTRSGTWLMASIAITGLLATGAVIAFAPDSQLSHEMFATAIGVPIAVILPIIAILSVTSEWSQRTGLTTFTFVPDRGRVVAAKGIVSVAIGLVSMAIAAGLGALGNLVGAAVTGTDPVWDLTVTGFSMVVLANVLGLLVGFMLGVLVRSSAAAIVAYFVYAFVIPTLAMVLAASQEWFRDLQPWVDFNYTQTTLYDGLPDAMQWVHLGATSLVWLVAPLAIGVWLVSRSEVK